MGFGQRVNAGEALAQAGEAQMQAGNRLQARANVNATESSDIMIAGALRQTARRIGRAQATERPDVMQATGGAFPSTIDTMPPALLPRITGTDVWVFPTTDGGEIRIRGGEITLTGGIETAVFLSLFGGNVEDDGRADNRETWWGNHGNTDPRQNMISRYQHLADGLPLSSGNLRRLEDAAAEDLAWLEDFGSTVRVSIAQTGEDRTRLSVQIDGLTLTFDQEMAA